MYVCMYICNATSCKVENARMVERRAATDLRRILGEHFEFSELFTCPSGSDIFAVPKDADNLRHLSVRDMSTLDDVSTYLGIYGDLLRIELKTSEKHRFYSSKSTFGTKNPFWSVAAHSDVLLFCQENVSGFRYYPIQLREREVTPPDVDPASDVLEMSSVYENDIATKIPCVEVLELVELLTRIFQLESHADRVNIERDNKERIKKKKAIEEVRKAAQTLQMKLQAAKTSRQKNGIREKIKNLRATEKSLQSTGASLKPLSNKEKKEIRKGPVPKRRFPKRENMH